MATKGKFICFHGSFGSRARAQAKAVTVKESALIRRTVRILMDENGITAVQDPDPNAPVVEDGTDPN